MQQQLPPPSAACLPALSAPACSRSYPLSQHQPAVGVTHSLSTRLSPNRALCSVQLDSLRAELEDSTLAYPPYYQQPFHAYPDGNMSWTAAFEQEPSRQVVASRTFPDQPAQEAELMLSQGIATTLLEFRQRQGLSAAPIQNVLDVGCGDGWSTRMLARTFPEAAITGIDASPYFLSVAQMQERARAASAGEASPSIHYLHRLAEDSRLPAASLDLVTIVFVFHECPADATGAIVQEAWRLLRPGGQLMIVDSNPDSESLRKLHPAIMLLREQTEPWMNEFRQVNFEQLLQQVGFAAAEKREVSSRHMAVMGVKPA